MGTALFTGVTGLLAHQRRLDVVANNIANVNTIGYRGSRTLFQDLFAQTIAGGSAPLGSFGGTNPQQIGLGVQIGSIDVDYGQGSLVTTGVSSDLAIQGNGFFVLSNDTLQTFSRDGSFTLNANGVLIEPGTGFRVQGYSADENGVINTDTQPIGDIVIPVGGTGIVRATTLTNLIGNLDSGTTTGETVSRTMEVFDSLGTARTITLGFTKTAVANQWTWTASFGNTQVGTGMVTFMNDGTLDPNDVLNTPTVTVPSATLQGTDTATPDPLVFTLNMTQITQLAANSDQGSDVTLRNQDGFPRGILESFNIGANGQVNGVFTNGLTRPIAQVALATFANVGGLSRQGSNAFLETPASGVAQVGVPSTGGRGIVSGGVLESSNVDLGTEFSELIITQRGFQANARTITAADTLLQEAVNLVR
ncbi:MAG: flagellar hook protein FlgE [Candidatus Hydrogenedentes bacterium]|nr:flagellar hook protein FlgE [Candidatus Hydrogenedentota bacterium]